MNFPDNFKFVIRGAYKAEDRVYNMSKVGYDEWVCTADFPSEGRCAYWTSYQIKNNIEHGSWRLVKDGK